MELHKLILDVNQLLLQGGPTIISNLYAFLRFNKMSLSRRDFRITGCGCHRASNNSLQAEMARSCIYEHFDQGANRGWIYMLKFVDETEDLIDFLGDGIPFMRRSSDNLLLNIFSYADRTLLVSPRNHTIKTKRGNSWGGIFLSMSRQCLLQDILLSRRSSFMV